MSRNFYSEIHLHLVWHTKNSRPLLVDQVQAATYRCLKQLIVKTPGAFVHQIGGIETHVHLCVTVPPTLTISQWIGQLKGASSHEVNHSMDHHDTILQWQTGYGVVSFGTGDLDWVKEYVQNQREHHAARAIHDRLERITQHHEEILCEPAQPTTARRPVNGPAEKR